MATTEERLAALEAKLAQLTATTPTTYYTHQYSGEEIDAATGRALTGGALDTSVTNVSNQLGTFVRPNLLDNWYFGSPVDQRGGKIIQQGKMAYRDAACTIEAGGVSETAMAVTKVSDTVYTFKGGDGNPYYVKAADVVRGYTGNGYTVDRWISDGKPVTIGSGIGLEAMSFLYQKLEQSTMDALGGKTITFSALTTSNGFLTGSWVVDNSNQSDTRIAENDEVILYRSPWTGNGWGINPKTATQILAAKLEIGPTQTLAHQENGVWVLNEIPKYSRELLDCRMYHVKFGYADKYCILGSGVARDGTFVSITVPIPAEMRTYPVTILMGVIIIRHSDGVNQSCTTLALDAIGVSSILLKIKASGLTPGDAYEAFLAPGNYLDVSCDL